MLRFRQITNNDSDSYFIVWLSIVWMYMYL